MGLGPAAIKLYLDLWQRGFYRNIKNVVEMGAQELHLKPADFEELVRVAGINEYRKEDFNNLVYWPGCPRCPARPFYELLGVPEYACVDLGGEHEAISLDLNLPLEDRSLYDKYDLVTDHGTNEHVFNTAEAYRTMHRLCKPQGFMLIAQVVFNGNGYFTYDLSFFEGMAAANDYRIHYSSYIVTTNTLTSEGSASQFHVPLSRVLIDTLDWTRVQQIGICYVMQKLADADFHYPYQGQYLSRVMGHHGYQLQFLPEPPSRTYLPVWEPSHILENTSAKNLLKHLLGRVLLIGYIFSRTFKRIKLKISKIIYTGGR